jgi:Ca-activated chloride channel family protein
MNGNWQTFHFGSPWVLAFLPATVLVLWWLGRAGRVPGLLISSVALVRAVGGGVRTTQGWRRDWLRWSAVCLLIGALAGPQLERGPSPEQAKAIDVMLLIDASRSMDTKDFAMEGQAVSRLDALRQVVGNFVKARPQDRIGILAFAEKPYLLCPLTLDHSWMMESLGNIQTALGTAMGSSIEAGVDLLRAGGNESRVMILITDGLNTSGSDPLQAAGLAKAAGVRLHTIAAVSYDETITSDFENNPLYVMAHTTGGRFFQAANTESLETIYGEIDHLERQHLQQLRSRNFTPLFALFAGMAGLMLGAETLLGATRWLRVP